MAAEWFYQFAGAKFGPVSLAELQALARAGAVARNTPVRKGTDGRWVRAGRVQGFFEPSGSPPTVAVRHVDEKPISREGASSAEKELRSPPSPPPMPKSAAEASPKDESCWRYLVTSARDSGQHEHAVEFAKQGIREHPRSDWLWRRLGGELTELDRLDEAEKALKEARRLNPNADRLWRYLAGLHRKRKNFEKEIETLEHLCELGKANATDLYQLGIAYRRHGNYDKAVEYYRLSLATKPSASQWCSMGVETGTQLVIDGLGGFC